MAEYISPDRKWKIILDSETYYWIKMSNELTEQVGQFTIKEIIEATKNIAPEIWKK